MEFGLRQLFFLTIGIVVGWLGLYLWRKYKHQQSDASSQNQPTNAPQKASPAEQDQFTRFKSATDAVLELNRSIRLDPAHTEAQVALIESIIDDGLEVLPIAYERLPNHELSWEVCRLLLHWLPKHVGGYAKLSPGQRVEQESRYQEGLDRMKGELDEFRRLLESGAEMDFSAALATIRLKFN